MANIDPAPSWANIRRLETTDRNMAGPGGILNDPTTSIAARLNLLRDNDTALGNSVAAVNARQDATDDAIANIEGQVINAPGTLSDLDHGAPISVVGDQFPDVLSIDNSRGPVLALNESISNLARRDAYLLSHSVMPISISGSDPNSLIGSTENGYTPVESQLVSFRTGSSVNTSSVSISLNGGPSRAIVSSSGTALAAGQLLGSTVYVARITSAGTLILTSPIPASSAQVSAGTNNINYATVANVSTIVAPTRDNGLRARYLVDGRILRSWNKNPTTRVVSISQGRVWKENNSAAVLYSINPLIDVEMTNRQVIMVDLDSAPDVNGRLTPYLATGNAASSANNGWQSGNKLVLYSVSNQQSGTDTLNIYGGGLYNGTGERQYEAGDILIDGSAGLISILTCGGINNNRFVEWRFGNSVRDTPPNPNVVAGDVYRLIGVYDATYSVERVKVRLQEICRTAEFETAIRQNGKSDFVGGGSHGNQIKYMWKAFVDGVEVNPASTIRARCKKFEFIQSSILYQYGELPSSGVWNQSQELGVVHTKWTWENGKLNIDNTIVISNNVTLDRTYLGIMPVIRRAAPLAGGSLVDIVTTGLRTSPGYSLEDLSTDTYPDFFNQSAIMQGFGSGGYMLKMKKTAGWDKPNRSSSFSASVDNKFYQNVTGSGYSATQGESIFTSTEYEISIP